ncbi:MAG: hypothetical protein Q9162_003194 [Coniocarpon cinnabarinum]
MKTQAALATLGSLLSVTLAAPSTSLESRIQRRALGLTHDPTPFEPATGDFEAPKTDNETQLAYSSNWSGAVLESPPAGSTFSQVTGSFTVPRPSAPSGGRGTYAASAWVGIDGDTYGAAILQTGCDFTASSSGGTAYDCWYEYFPNPLTDFSNFAVTAGDVITATVVTTSATAGTATLRNSRTGQQVTQQLTAPNANARLAGQNAEWIVEDFSSGGNLVPFANFGSVSFTGATATAGGRRVDTTGSQILEIQQNGRVLTSASASGSGVQVRYTG